MQIWVPDTKAAGFAGECARQAGLIRDAAQGCATDDEAWSTISDTTGWTE
ncbi:MAG: antitoxin MazE-like protein [Janthinobacterium lividum]